MTGIVWHVKKEDLIDGEVSLERFCKQKKIEVQVTEDPTIDWLPTAEWNVLEDILKGGEPIIVVTDRDLGSHGRFRKLFFIR